MKKLFFLLLAIFSLSIISCRQDGDWVDNGANGTFGFTIERDKDFAEKAVGEGVDIKFNIVPKYNFETVKTTFKFVTDKNGTLSLNGNVLNSNEEYTFTEKNNIFKYVGNEAGTHQVKIMVRNEKGEVKEEVFDFKFAVSEFTVNSIAPVSDIYQGREVNYIIKVTPNNSSINNGAFKIRFDSYTANSNSKIFYKDQQVQLGTFYDILPNDLQNIQVKLNSWDSGSQKLIFTVQNATVTKTGNEILQDVKPRAVNIVSVAPTKTVLALNETLSINGVVTKNPFQDNADIYYKTWISSNSEPNAITNSNNAWQLYSLGTNNTINLNNLKANSFGTHTYNIQFKDEFGNLSEVKSFDIKVEEKLQFLGTPSHVINIYRMANPAGFNTAYTYFINNVIVNFNAKSGTNNKITKYIIEAKFSMLNDVAQYSKTIELPEPQETVNISQTIGIGQLVNSNFNFGTVQPTDATFKLTVFDSQGNTIVYEGVPSFTKNY